MKSFLTALAICLAPAVGLAADCTGRNLIAALPAAEQASLRANVGAIPYHEGLFWQARKGDARITLIGTYHFDDPRHARTVARFLPEIEQADTLLVELGFDEEAQLKQALARDPGLIVDADGPTLPEQMGQAEWEELSTAMAERGVPAVMTSRMRPWYVATLLGISPCMMRQMAQEGGQAHGLDKQLMEEARAAEVPVRALEPWDTVLRIFGSLTAQEGIDMIVYGLPAARHADDYAATLIDAYFEEDVWTIWEFGRLDAYRSSGLPKAEVDRLTDEAQDLLMDRRNRSWIAPLTTAAETAAGRGKGVVAAFGALHLPGEDGMLRLLEKDGWTIERLAQ